MDEYARAPRGQPNEAQAAGSPPPKAAAGRAGVAAGIEVTIAAATTTGKPPAFDPQIATNEPGCALLLRERGHTLVARGYGVSDLESLTPIDSRTNFRLASISKQFTAMAIMLLVHDQRLRYDATLDELLPGFQDCGKRIAVRHLLTHTSGLADYEAVMMALERSAGPVYSAGHPIEDHDVLALLKQLPTTKFPAGSRWAYSNSGYVVLGLIIERVARQPFANFLADRIFGPLGMHGTVVYRHGRDSVRQRAFGHTPVRGGFVVTDQTATSATQGDGGVYSNLEDLARWDGALERHTLLPAMAMREALTPVQLADGALSRWPEAPDTDNLAPGQTVSYGFGWFLDPYLGHDRMWHFGNSQGFRTSVMRFPADRLTVAVLCNRTDLDARALAIGAATPYLVANRSGPAS